MTQSRRFPTRYVVGVCAVAFGVAGCQFNPMYSSEGTDIDIRADRTFYVTVASKQIMSMGGPDAEEAQTFIRRKLQERGCEPKTTLLKGGYAWGGYWYATGGCK